MDTFDQKYDKVKEMTTADMEKHIISKMELVRATLAVLEREEAIKQIEILIRTTAELARSYAILNAVTIKL